MKCPIESDDALLQHQTSKHGKDVLIQPDWYKKEEERQEISVGSMKCPICRVQFSSQQAFQDHLKQLAPNTVLKNVCENCSKSFGDTRALRQHRLRCLIAH
jgi:hypothetical protein